MINPEGAVMSPDGAVLMAYICGALIATFFVCTALIYLVYRGFYGKTESINEKQDSK